MVKAECRQARELIASCKTNKWRVEAMRTDENIGDEELKKLWETDAKRALYEWSFRIYETPYVMDDPAPFLFHLFEKFEEAFNKKPFFQVGISDLRNLSNMTKAFDSGYVTLMKWTDFVRSMAGGEAWKETHLVTKTDPEVTRHLRSVYTNMLRTGQIK
jgi:hypothetical protein